MDQDGIEEAIAELDIQISGIQLALDNTTQQAFQIKRELTRLEQLRAKLENERQNDGN